MPQAMYKREKNVHLTTSAVKIGYKHLWNSKFNFWMLKQPHLFLRLCLCCSCLSKRGVHFPIRPIPLSWIRRCRPFRLESKVSWMRTFLDFDFEPLSSFSRIAEMASFFTENLDLHPRTSKASKNGDFKAQNLPRNNRNLIRARQLPYWKNELTRQGNQVKGSRLTAKPVECKKVALARMCVPLVLPQPDRSD